MTSTVCPGQVWLSKYGVEYHVLAVEGEWAWVRLRYQLTSEAYQPNDMPRTYSLVMFKKMTCYSEDRVAS